jgi:hypothetical protein
VGKRSRPNDSAERAMKALADEGARKVRAMIGFTPRAEEHAGIYRGHLRIRFGQVMLRSTAGAADGRAFGGFS